MRSYRVKFKLDVFGVPGKLVKYVVHLSKMKKIKKIKIKSSYKLSKLQSTNQPVFGLNEF
jgi:hypothetical protein